VIDADEAWKSNLRRFKIEYVAPRPGDPKLADVLVLLTPGDETVEVLRFAHGLATDGSLAGKIAAPLATRNPESALEPIYAAVARAGMTIVPFRAEGNVPDAARAHGTALVKMARAWKQGAV
jgi:hypothetical protein